jgi:hypothetical protein
MDVGETGQEYKSKKELGGNGGAVHGGGSRGSNSLTVGLMVASIRTSGAAAQRQEEGGMSVVGWRMEPREEGTVVDGTGGR